LLLGSKWFEDEPKISNFHPGKVHDCAQARLDEGISGDIPCPDCGKAISEEDLARHLD
jgi:hypothetical protein